MRKILCFVLLLILLDGCSCNKDICYPRFGAENLTESWCYSTDRNAAQAAATLENNAWRSRKRVVADYVPECMHHHSDDKAVVRHRPRRLRSARLAQAEGGAIITGVCLAPYTLVRVFPRLQYALIATGTALL